MENPLVGKVITLADLVKDQVPRRIGEKFRRETPQELWRDRPLSVRQKIRQGFQSARREEHQGFGYIFTGDKQYSYFNRAINTTELFDTLTEGGTNDINILDVGTGDGQLLKFVTEHNSHVRPHGISAHEFRTQSNIAKHQADGIDLKIRNAETLSNYTQPNSYDAIVSRETMIHLIDPLGSLAQMYEAVKPGGIILLDSFDINGISGGVVAIVEFLKQQGYAVMADYDYSLEGNKLKPTRLNSLIIKKTKTHLQLPVTYDTELQGGSCIYRATTSMDLPTIPLDPSLETFYNTTATAINDSFAKLFVGDIVNLSSASGVDWVYRQFDFYLSHMNKRADGLDKTKISRLREQISSVVSEWIENHRNPDKIEAGIKRFIGANS